MNPLELLRLNPFNLLCDTEDGTYYLPDPWTMEEALMAPQLDLAFAMRILNGYLSIYPSTDISIIEIILSRHSSHFWEELTEELSNLEKYKPKFYTVFSLHRFRREFINEQPRDSESLLAFSKWSGWLMEGILRGHASRGGEYKVIDGNIHISCNLLRFHINFLHYCSEMLPIQLKYSPSHTIAYKSRYKVIEIANKQIEFPDRDISLTDVLDTPIQSSDETKDEFKKCQDTARKNQNKEAQTHKILESRANLVSRFSKCAESLSYLYDENPTEFYKEKQINYLKNLERNESKRRRKGRPGKKSKQLKTNIIDSPTEIMPVLSQCQFCYRYEITESKTTHAWHCNSPTCKSAYRAWLNDLNLNHHIHIEDLRLM